MSKKIAFHSPSRRTWITLGVLTLLIFIARTLGNR